VNESLKGVLTLLAFLLLAVGGFFAARHWQAAGPAYERIAPAQPCDLRAGPCSQPVAGGRVSFEISPNDIPLMQTLTLRLRADGLAPGNVEVDIRGLNMDMGLNRTRLEPAGEGHWEAETILPICSQRRMEWEAAVRLGPDPAVEIPFPFFTVRP